MIVKKRRLHAADHSDNYAEFCVVHLSTGAQAKGGGEDRDKYFPEKRTRMTHFTCAVSGPFPAKIARNDA